MERVKVWNIVFLQGDDYHGSDASDPNLDDMGRDELLDYLSQWHMNSDLDHYDCNEYDASDLDSEFLGYRVDGAETEGYLLSHNTRLGYAGLAWFQVVEEQSE